MNYLKGFLAGSITAVVSVLLFGLLPAIAMGIINSSEDGAWIVDHTTVAIVASLGFLAGFVSMLRRASRKFPTQVWDTSIAGKPFRRMPALDRGDRNARSTQGVVHRD